MQNMLIDPATIPKGQKLKCDAQLYLGNKTIRVPGIVKSFILKTGQSLSHTSERQTVVHLLKTLALDDKTSSENNECFVVDGSQKKSIVVPM
jgi:hypothetical protein